MIKVEEIILELDRLEDQLEKDLRTAVITPGLGKTQDDFRAEFEEKLRNLYHDCVAQGYKGKFETFLRLNQVEFQNHSQHHILIVSSVSSGMSFDLVPGQKSFYRFREICESYHGYKRVWYKENDSVGLTKRKSYQRLHCQFPEVEFLNESFPQSGRVQHGCVPNLSINLPWLIPTYHKVHIYLPLAQYQKLIIKKDKDGKFVEERRDKRPAKELQKIEDMKIEIALRRG